MNTNVTSLLKVDMSKGTQGLVQFRDGRRLWCVSVQKDGELYKVRLDMAVYHHVDINGRVNPSKEDRYDIIKFDPNVGWLSAMRERIPTEIRLC